MFNDDDFDDGYEDEFDRYEDYVTETGHDPYGVYDGAFDVPRVQALMRTVRHLTRRIAGLLYVMRHGKNSVNVDDIPF